MRDRNFVAEHRGGRLSRQHHHCLMEWACKCAEHVLPLLSENNQGLEGALHVGRAWVKGKASVGDARKASVEAHRVARESSDQTSSAVARSVGHAVATAHMADHSLGSALYALKAVNSAGGSIDAERKWQNGRLPKEISEMVLAELASKEKHFKI